MFLEQKKALLHGSALLDGLGNLALQGGHCGVQLEGLEGLNSLFEACISFIPWLFEVNG